MIVITCDTKKEIGEIIRSSIWNVKMEITEPANMMVMKEVTKEDWIKNVKELGGSTEGYDGLGYFYLVSVD